jgi:hypothetical protein
VHENNGQIDCIAGKGVCRAREQLTVYSRLEMHSHEQQHYGELALLPVTLLDRAKIRVRLVPRRPTAAATETARRRTSELYDRPTDCTENSQHIATAMATGQ